MSFVVLSKRLLSRSPLRMVAAPAYAQLVRTELAIAERLFSAASGPTAEVDLSEVTAVIKTFERPAELKRLVTSLRRLHPELQLLVVDDSKSPLRLPGVRTLVLPYDSGVGRGRNAGFAAVDTPYLLNLDDDFVFIDGRGLPEALRWLQENPIVDLLGGRVVNLPWFRNLDGLVESDGHRIDQRPVAHYLLNFYLARTERVRSVSYDDRLKRVEHRDFFARCSSLCCVHFEELWCLHARTPFNREYMAQRTDISADRAYLLTKWT